MLAVYVQKSRTEDAGAVAESVRKKLKTGEKIDRTQHQLNAVDDSRTTSTEADDRLYAMFVLRFIFSTLTDASVMSVKFARYYLPQQ